MLFLHKKGLFAECVKNWKTIKNPSTSAEVLTAVYGKSIDDIESDWNSWVSSQPIDENVKLVEYAFVKTEPQWQQWWRLNQHRLYWSDQEQIYKVK